MAELYTDAEYEKANERRKKESSPGSILHNRTQDRRARLVLHGLVTLLLVAAWLILAAALGSTMLATIVVGMLGLLVLLIFVLRAYFQMERISKGLWLQAGSLLVAFVISMIAQAFSAPPVSYAIGPGMIMAVSVLWLFLPIHIVPIAPGEVYHFNRFFNKDHHPTTRRNYTLEYFRPFPIEQEVANTLKAAGIDEEAITILMEYGKTNRHIQRLKETIQRCPHKSKRDDAEKALQGLLASFPDVQFHICAPLDESYLIWNSNEELSIKIKVTNALTQGPPINASLDCTCRFFPSQMHPTFDLMVEKWRGPDDARKFVTEFMQNAASLVLCSILGEMDYERALRIGIESDAFKQRFLEQMAWTKSFSGIQVMPTMLQFGAEMDQVIADAKLARQAAHDRTAAEVERLIQLLGTDRALEKTSPEIWAVLPPLLNEHLRNYYLNIETRQDGARTPNFPPDDRIITPRKKNALNNLDKLLKRPDEKD